MHNISYHPTIKKIKGFKKLKDGWNFGSGKAFNYYIIQYTINFHNNCLKQFAFETDAFPGEDGDIMVSFYYKDHILDFWIKNKDDIEFTHKCNDQKIENMKSINYNKTLKIIEQFRNEFIFLK